MSTTITTQLTGVPETLMITLYARAMEQQQPNPILLDQKAVEIIDQIDYDFSKFKQGWSSQLGCVIRAGHIDRIVQNFINAHPDALIVSLGAGLCTRYARLDTAQVQWHDIDLPEVIELRRQLFEETTCYRMMAHSLLDFDWMDNLPRQPQQAVMVIYEGVAMYLTEADNQALLQALSKHLAPLRVVFDVLSRKAARRTQHHDTVSKTTAQFQWGIDRSQDLETWSPSFTLKQEEFYLKHFLDAPNRLPQPWRLISQVVPAIPMALFKNSGRIVMLQVGQDT